MANPTHRLCDVPDCGSAHFACGKCNIHYYRQRRIETKVNRYATCAWCGEHKPLAEMRQPQTDRGKTPSTCYACRAANPELAWCDAHNEPHARSNFTLRPRFAIGITNICVAAQSQKASEARKLPDIECVSCGDVLTSWNFTGGRQKAKCCRRCVESNEGSRWCVDCKKWLSESLFHRTGRENRFMTVRCRPCRGANNHGMTVSQILERQGSVVPECAACGSTDMLQIDHDHRCCPAANGCHRCVRGYLCHQCNTSEGLLVTAERARLLADYMERHAGTPFTP